MSSGDPSILVTRPIAATVLLVVAGSIVTVIASRVRASRPKAEAKPAT